MFKDAIYEQLAAAVGRQRPRGSGRLSAPKRLELLDLLCQGPRTVEALAEQAAISVANASQHLQVLRAARLVDAEKKGLYVEYRLADDEVCRFFVALRGSPSRGSPRSTRSPASTSSSAARWRPSRATSSCVA
jgi:DNA-binding transcriptional ArsR family regulator